MEMLLLKLPNSQASCFVWEGVHSPTKPSPSLWPNGHAVLWGWDGGKPQAPQ